jgi:nucleoside-diphosphate-sugar epimerase
VRTAVIGATGVIGRALTPVLAARGEVIAVSRRPRGPAPAGVRALAADASDAASLRGALDGAAVV